MHLTSFDENINTSGMTEVARGREPLTNTPSKLVLNIDNPIFAMKTSQFYTPQYYAVNFSSGISLFYRRCHAAYTAAPGHCPDWPLMSAAPPQAYVEGAPGAFNH